MFESAVFVAIWIRLVVFPLCCRCGIPTTFRVPPPVCVTCVGGLELVRAAVGGTLLTPIGQPRTPDRLCSFHTQKYFFPVLHHPYNQTSSIRLPIPGLNTLRKTINTCTQTIFYTLVNTNISVYTDTNILNRDTEWAQKDNRTPGSGEIMQQQWRKTIQYILYAMPCHKIQYHNDVRRITMQYFGTLKKIINYKISVVLRA